MERWYAADLPWAPVQSPALMLERQPTLLVGEAAFICLALAALAHALRNGRQHVLLWLGALIGGCCNDVFFMVLPFVDNFWHAQCFLMLTPRLPLYILAVYVAFIYVPVAASWRLTRPPLARFVAGALTAGLLYAPFDLVGAKHLWWTWHDTDAAVQERWLGVPIGSTMFTITHTFTFHLLLHIFALSRAQPLSSLRFGLSLIGVCLLGTPSMMLAMSPSQMLQLRFGEDGQPTQLPGRPDVPSLILQLVLLLAAGLWSARKHAPVPAFLPYPKPGSSGYPLDVTLWFAAAAYFAALCAVMALGDPAAVVAEGVHQEIGKCYVHDVDLSNYSRFKFLCVTDFDEDFHLDCAPNLDPKTPSWYTLCGKAHGDRPTYVLATVALGIAASTSLGIMLLMAPSKRQVSSKARKRA